MTPTQEMLGDERTDCGVYSNKSGRVRLGKQYNN